MAEQLRKAIEMAESASETLSVAARDIAAEIEKATKAIEQEVCAVDQLTERGAKLNDALQKVVIDLQKDFQDARNESEKVINQTRMGIMSNIDNFKSSTSQIIDSKSPEANQQISSTKVALLKSCDDLKSRTDRQIANLLEVVYKALTHCQKLYESAIDVAIFLNCASEKTLSNAQEKVQSEFKELTRMSEELSRQCANDFAKINEATKEEMLVILEQVKAMSQDERTSPENAKAILESATEALRAKALQSIESAWGDISKSLNDIQKHSERSLANFKKTTEKPDDSAKKSHS